MKTRRWGPVFAFVTVLAFVSAACKDSNTVVAPLEPIHIAGEWIGTFDSIDDFDCPPGTPASATFTHAGGSAVEGVLHMTRGGCGAENVLFHGSLVGERLEGTLERGGGYSLYNFEPGSTVEGTATKTKLDLTLINNSRFPFPIPGGTMHLHR